jgi:type III pantothenate kinase
VDIGNSAVKYGVRQGGEWVTTDYIDHLLGREMPAEILAAVEELGLAAATAEAIAGALEEDLTDADLDLKQCSGIGVSSTCPGAEELEKLLGKLAPCPLKRVGKELKPGLKTEYRKPSEIGADRWANVVAAVHLHGAPVVVIDAGTALTSEVVNAKGAFVGGSIGLGLTPLSMGVAFISPKLAEAHAQELREEPPLVGRSTTEAIHSGLALQMAAAADRFAEEGLAVVGGATVLLTGGHADLCLQLMHTPAVHEPLLTLEGIRLMDHYD